MKKLRLVAWAAVLVMLGWNFGFSKSTDIHKPLFDTVAVTADHLRAEVERRNIETNGPLAWVRGFRELEPRVVYTAPDTIEVPGICIENVGGDVNGPAYISELVINAPVWPDSVRTYSRRLSDGFDLFKCQRFSITSAGFACDMPRFGIVGLFGDVGAERNGVTVSPFARVGLSWQRWRNSPWSISTALESNGSFSAWVGFRFNLIGG